MAFRKTKTSEKSRVSSQRKLDRRTAFKAAVSAAAIGVGACPATAKGDGPVGKLVQLGGRVGTSNTPLKQRAADDYCRSLQPFGGRLASPVGDLLDTASRPDEVHFGVVVIGSGYGASIAAARISQRLRSEHRICMLERGKEWVPGTFPDTFSNLTGNVRSMMAGPTRGQLIRPLGLFNVMMNDEVNVLTGSGLGGGSLINAGVALRPHSEVFQQQRWPESLHNVEVLGPYYAQVAQALSLCRTPRDQTAKVRVRSKAAASLNSNPSFIDRSNLSVMYDHRHLDDQMRNPQGMIQRACTLCGDCVNGCNVGAKNSLAMNYLPVARHNGTEIYTQVEVNSIEKLPGYFRIHMTYIESQCERIRRHPVSINSQMVVVGAGSPASATILLDSQNEDFQFSPKLGCHWSGNGDTIGLITQMPPGTNIGGHGTFPSKNGPVGPTVQTSLNYYRDIELRRRLLIQDAGVPRGAGNAFSILMRDPELDHSMIMLGMGHDGANGRLVKKDGRWQVKWDGLKESEYRKMVIREFKRLAAAHGGTYKRPSKFGDNLATVHPLGGCGMSDDPAHGPVNQLGQVYDFRAGGYQDSATGLPAVHEGLYVADGSIIPTALGVNPYMTIGALSERIAQHIINNPAHRQLFQ